MVAPYRLTDAVAIGIFDKKIGKYDISRGNMKQIFLIAHDASSVPGVTGALEIFNIANILNSFQNPGADPLFACTVVAAQQRPHQPCDGLRVDFERGLFPYSQADAVVMTGFLYSSVDELANKMEQAKETVDWIRRQYRQGAIVAASCSGTVLLAETGLLDGKSATTSWWLAQLFQKRYPEITLQIDRLLVEHGRLLSAGAVTSYTNLVLRLVDIFAGKTIALASAKMMLVDINKYSQAPYMMLQSILDHSDNLVAKAQYWINQHLRSKIDLMDLSDHLAVSYRTLIRRFKNATGETPIQYIQKSRIESAKQLLETTDLNLETVMERVGYADVSAFSLLFKRLTRLTPREYRRQFSPQYRAVKESR